MSISKLNQIETPGLFPITAEITEDGYLIIGGCNTATLSKQYGTPLYIIDKKTFCENSNAYINSLKKHLNNFLVLYAGKAFSNTAIFTIADKLGLGLDVVSGGEIYTAIKTKVDLSKIYFHGNNKSQDEIEFAIKSSVGRIVCDNYHELNLLNETAKKHNKKIDILIRLTPGIECHTHEYIKTGHLDSKFGFDLEYYDDVLSLIKNKYKNLNLIGLHSHIGSQIFELIPFEDTIKVLFEHFKIAKDKYGIELKELNIGGGLGISYIKEEDPPTVEKWAITIANTIKTNAQKHKLLIPKLICEPGRSLIANSGITLYRVGSIKEVPNERKFISVDGGMADNPRPITYQAKYTAVVANKMLEKKDLETVTIAGRYCETGDILIKDITLPKLTHGDLIAVLSTGAYNYSMSSNYNMVPRPACILVENGKSEIIIERETFEDITKTHKMPKDLIS